MRQGTKQAAPPPTGPVLSPTGLALGLGVMGSQPLCDTGQQQRLLLPPLLSPSSPFSFLLPATIHFRAGKSFTIPSHCFPSGEPATTRMVSVGWGKGDDTGSGPFLPLGNLKLPLSHLQRHRSLPTASPSSLPERPVFSPIAIIS